MKKKTESWQNIGMSIYSLPATLLAFLLLGEYVPGQIFATNKKSDQFFRKVGFVVSTVIYLILIIILF